MAPRSALRQTFSDPARGHERLLVIFLVVITLGILADTIVTTSLIVFNDRRINRNQLAILNISQRVALNTEKMQLLDEKHYTNTLQFRALAAQLNAVRQTLALPKLKPTLKR